MTQKHPARPPTQRQLRVGEDIRHVRSGLFQRGDFRDPGLQALNITVTEVRVSPDLRAATAFVTPLGGGQLGDTVKTLRHAAGFLRTLVAKEMKLRFAPTLSFEADTSFEVASRIDNLLNLPEVARDLAPADQKDIADAVTEAEDPDDGA